MRIVLKPTKNRPTRNTIGDRLIPTRAGNNWQVAFHLKDENPVSPNARTRDGAPVGNDASGRDRSIFRSVLENEVLNSGIEDPRELQNKKRRVFSVSSLPQALSFHKTDVVFHTLQYESPLKQENRIEQPYSLSPLSPASQKLLQSPRKAARKIAKVPFKVRVVIT